MHEATDLSGAHRHRSRRMGTGDDQGAYEVVEVGGDHGGADDADDPLQDDHVTAGVFKARR